MTWEEVLPGSCLACGLVMIEVNAFTGKWHCTECGAFATRDEDVEDDYSENSSPREVP